MTALPMKKEPYAAGTAGIRQSLRAMQNKARETLNDMASCSELRGWALDAYKEAGIDGRSGTSIKARAQAILDKYRKHAVYVPDPPGVEWIQAPHVTLCLRGFCFPGGDCDDGALAVLTAMLSVGLPAFLVRQQFGIGTQEHVLIGLKDDMGTKLYADPSTNDPIYSGSKAMSEDWVDAMTGDVGNIGASGPHMITLGAVPSGLAGISEGTPRHLAYAPGFGWVERTSDGRTWLYNGSEWNEIPYGPVGFGAGQTILGGWASQNDVTAFDAQLGTAVTATDQAVQACSTLSQEDKTSWSGIVAAYNTQHQHLQDVAGASSLVWDPIGRLIEYNNILEAENALKAQVASWQTYLSNKQCQNVPTPSQSLPQAPVPTPQSQSQSQAIKDLGSLALALGGGAIMIVGAYGIYRLVASLPSK